MPPAKQSSQTNSDADLTRLELILNTFSGRIEKTEKDFVHGLQGVEKKLDQLVDLARSVAVLDEKSSKYLDDVQDIRRQHADHQSKCDTSIQRLHTRIDEGNTHIRQEMATLKDSLGAKVDSSLKQSDEVGDELSKWLNRGWGVWGLATVIFIVSSGLFYRWIDSVERDKASGGAVIEQLKTDNQSNKQQIELLTRMSKDVADVTKRTDQRLGDNERQMDMVLSQLKAMQPQPQQQGWRK